MPGLFTALRRYTHPWTLLFGILMFGLGLGIVNYLGKPIDFITYIVAQACVTLLQVSGHLLDGVFKLLEKGPFRNPGSKSDDASPRSITQIGRILLELAVVTLTGAAILTIVLITANHIDGTAIFILGLIFIFVILYAVPPFRLVSSGYGELINAIILVNLFPAFAYLSQVGEWHRLIPMFTFPLTGLFLAMMLALSLISYSDDVKKGEVNLMARLSWQRGMVLHNYLILFAYLILTVALLLGLPWSLYWPGLVTLPLGLYQIFQMRQIAAGVKPNWRILRITAIALPTLTAYFFAITLWIG